MTEMSVEDARTLREKATGTIAKALEGLDECITTIRADLESSAKYDPKLASHLSYMASGAVQVLDGLRKAEAHDRQTIDKMGRDERLELLADYIREMPREDRAHMLRLLADMDAEEGVLGARTSKPKRQRRAK